MGLKVENVTKKYGNKTAVDNVSFSIDKPGIFGLLGTNGAGKTTIIRMILDILTKDSGNITWNEKTVSRKSVNFGYLPEERGVYPKIKIIDQLVYFAQLKGIKKEDSIKAINKWAKKLEVEEYMNMTPDKLSKGNQQKVQFMTAIIHDPELLVLDEPFSGLDPVNTGILTKVIFELIKNGKYIIMSAHEMHTIETLCSDIIILDKGKTVLKGNLNEIKKSYPANRVLIETDNDIKGIIKEFKLEIENHHDNYYLIKIDNEKEAHDLLKALFKKNILINKFEISKPTLNDIFIEKVGK